MYIVARLSSYIYSASNPVYVHCCSLVKLHIFGFQPRLCTLLLACQATYIRLPTPFMYIVARLSSYIYSASNPVYVHCCSLVKLHIFGFQPRLCTLSLACQATYIRLPTPFMYIVARLSSYIYSASNPVYVHCCSLVKLHIFGFQPRLCTLLLACQATYIRLPSPFMYIVARLSSYIYSASKPIYVHCCSLVKIHIFGFQPRLCTLLLACQATYIRLPTPFMYIVARLSSYIYSASKPIYVHCCSLVKIHIFGFQPRLCTLLLACQATYIRLPTPFMYIVARLSSYIYSASNPVYVHCCSLVKLHIFGFQPRLCTLLLACQATYIRLPSPFMYIVARLSRYIYSASNPVYVHCCSLVKLHIFGFQPRLCTLLLACQATYIRLPTPFMYIVARLSSYIYSASNPVYVHCCSLVKIHIFGFQARLCTLLLACQATYIRLPSPFMYIVARLSRYIYSASNPVYVHCCSLVKLHIFGFQPRLCTLLLACQATYIRLPTPFMYIVARLSSYIYSASNPVYVHCCSLVKLHIFGFQPRLCTLLLACQATYIRLPTPFMYIVARLSSYIYSASNPVYVHCRSLVKLHIFGFQPRLCTLSLACQATYIRLPTPFMYIVARLSRYIYSASNPVYVHCCSLVKLHIFGFQPHLCTLLLACQDTYIRLPTPFMYIVARLSSYIYSASNPVYVHCCSLVKLHIFGFQPRLCTLLLACQATYIRLPSPFMYIVARLSRYIYSASNPVYVHCCSLVKLHIFGFQPRLCTLLLACQATYIRLPTPFMYIVARLSSYIYSASNPVYVHCCSLVKLHIFGFQPRLCTLLLACQATYIRLPSPFMYIVARLSRYIYSASNPVYVHCCSLVKLHIFGFQPRLCTLLLACQDTYIRLPTPFMYIVARLSSYIYSASKPIYVHCCSLVKIHIFGFQPRLCTLLLACQATYIRLPTPFMYIVARLSSYIYSASNPVYVHCCSLVKLHIFGFQAHLCTLLLACQDTYIRLPTPFMYIVARLSSYIYSASNPVYVHCCSLVKLHIFGFQPRLCTLLLACQATYIRLPTPFMYIVARLSSYIYSASKPIYVHCCSLVKIHIFGFQPRLCTLLLACQATYIRLPTPFMYFVARLSSYIYSASNPVYVHCCSLVKLHIFGFQPRLCTLLLACQDTYIRLPSPFMYIVARLSRYIYSASNPVYVHCRSLVKLHIFGFQPRLCTLLLACQATYIRLPTPFMYIVARLSSYIYSASNPVYVHCCSLVKLHIFGFQPRLCTLLLACQATYIRLPTPFMYIVARLSSYIYSASNPVYVHCCSLVKLHIFGFQPRLCTLLLACQATYIRLPTPFMYIVARLSSYIYSASNPVYVHCRSLVKLHIFGFQPRLCTLLLACQATYIRLLTPFMYIVARLSHCISFFFSFTLSRQLRNLFMKFNCQKVFSLRLETIVTCYAIYRVSVKGRPIPLPHFI